MAMSRGKLITIEGIDGAGKSTLAAALESKLRDDGVDVRLLREPGGVRAAERIREVVMDPELEVTSRAEALLYAAARAQLVEETVLPLLERGTWALLDRFVDSSLAYQGAGRELGMDRVALINEFATGGLRPDRTLLLVLDLGLARERSRERAAPRDRLESEEQGFFARTQDGYLRLAAAEPDRIRLITAGAPAEEVLEQAWSAVRDLV
jgi:dTMP kinase